MRRRRACPGCGRLIAVRRAIQNNGGGKEQAKHRCPHGTWCIFGEPQGNNGWNYARCRECRAAIGGARSGDVMTAEQESAIARVASKRCARVWLLQQKDSAYTAPNWEVMRGLRLLLSDEEQDSLLRENWSPDLTTRRT